METGKSGGGIIGMTDNYTSELAKQITDVKHWNMTPYSTDYIMLIKSIDEEIKVKSISAKIASILIKTQIMQDMTKHLINLSTIYIKAELWPTMFEPAYDNGKEQMNGWYIDYFEKYCITFENKDSFIKNAKEINRIRNKVAHNIVGKNTEIINETYKKCEKLAIELIKDYSKCVKILVTDLIDVSERVDFHELME